jgi:hypothetical protein
VLWICIVVAIVGAGIGWQAMRYAQVASGYIARQMCSCLYVQNRSEESCRAEIGPQIGQAQIVYFNERVVVNFLGLDRAQASLTPGYGCAVRAYEGAMPSGLDLTIDDE